MPSLPPLDPPPMSMSSIATSVPIPPSIPPPCKPPVLASDILREEVAPFRPAQRAVRAWLGAYALAFALAATASMYGFGAPMPGALEGAWVTAIVAAIAAIAPVPYAARASLAAIAGLVPLTLGALGEGPLAAIGFEGPVPSVAGIVLVTFLPGALLFRARYRAFRAARGILGIALALAAPALFFLGAGAIDAAADLVERVSDAAVLVASLAAFGGFMGEETTGGGNGVAALIVVTHALRLPIIAGSGLAAAIATGSSDDVARWIEHAAAIRYGLWGPPIAGIGEFIGSALVAYALFQLLAVLFAREARKVDVHRIVGPSAEGERMGSISSEE